MQIILLSGGSGTRLWPLSNDARSKQFLRLLPTDEPNKRESMIQRVVRQIGEAKMDADVTVATSESQRDSVLAQIGSTVDIVTEPSRRDTFPAIVLACEYLAKAKGCGRDEVVVVMPCDPYTQLGYFEAIRKMALGIERNEADMTVMGIRPTNPSSKYGYVVPDGQQLGADVIGVKRFTEKPDVATAERLIAEGAMWNGGVFAFRLGYILDIADRYVSYPTFKEYYDNYASLPKISFDYEVAEKAESMGMVEYAGEWKDLGTWNTLTDELPLEPYGNVMLDDTNENTHVFNELGVPVLCMGTRNLVVAASPDGIIVSDKSKSENVKKYASELKTRPMYEERRWGTYRVVDFAEFDDGTKVVTKHVRINAGARNSYQYHAHREETCVILDGEGEVTIDDVTTKVRPGDTVHFPVGSRHSIAATTPLTFIEIQKGPLISESDIVRLRD